MNTTWPKLTYPVRPAMKFIEYARDANKSKLMRSVSTNVGIHGPQTASTTRNPARPQRVGADLRRRPKFIEESLRGGARGPG